MSIGYSTRTLINFGDPFLLVFIEFVKYDTCEKLSIFPCNVDSSANLRIFEKHWSTCGFGAIILIENKRILANFIFKKKADDRAIFPEEFLLNFNRIFIQNLFAKICNTMVDQRSH